MKAIVKKSIVTCKMVLTTQDHDNTSSPQTVSVTIPPVEQAVVVVKQPKLPDWKHVFLYIVSLCSILGTYVYCAFALNTACNWMVTNAPNHEEHEKKQEFSTLVLFFGIIIPLFSQLGYIVANIIIIKETHGSMKESYIFRNNNHPTGWSMLLCGIVWFLFLVIFIVVLKQISGHDYPDIPGYHQIQLSLLLGYFCYIVTYIVNFGILKHYYARIDKYRVFFNMHPLSSSISYSKETCLC